MQRTEKNLINREIRRKKKKISGYELERWKKSGVNRKEREEEKGEMDL